MLCFIIVLFLFQYVTCRIDNFNSMQIKDLKITKCENKNYPVTVSDVFIQIGKNSQIKVSGSLFSEVDLVGPIKASVSIERDILGIWIPIPCEKNLGSYTYNDLCDYGYPANATCPEIFLNNKVPCRCPIPKGNYTITPTVSLSVEASDILSGTYKGSIIVTQNQLLLSCHNVYFILYETYYKNNMYTVTQI